MSELSPLHHWHLQDNRPLCFDLHRTLDLAEFKSQVHAWITTLSLHQGQRWALYHQSPDQFLAILLALWHLGKTVYVPGNNLPETVQRLGNYVDGFVGDFANAVECNEYSASSIAPVSFAEMDLNYVALVIFTSGSSGEPKPIQKTLSELNNEIAMLERQWSGLRAESVISTVTHHHAYGIVFALLWPFCCSRSFATELCEFSEGVLDYAKQQRSVVLVSSPVHLSRLNLALNWSSVSQRIVQVFSAAAPLSLQTSLQVAELLKASVVEIYGSSETGAIAWRCRREPIAPEHWQLLPGVSFTSEEDELLRLTTPACREKVVVPDDIVLTEGGCFDLLGRRDQIIKIEGKRVSLSAIEQKLNQHEWVNETKAIVLKRKRQEVALLIALTMAGREFLMKEGKRLLNQRLKSYLVDDFEMVVLPRRWRYLAQLPYNSQGKLIQQDLIDMFNSKSSLWPEITHSQQEGEETLLDCFISEDLQYFDGHFDEMPVLPGITQVHWAESYGREHFDIDGTFSHLEAVKFQQIIQPLMSVTLSLSYQEQKKKLSFVYRSSQGVHSSGRICFR